uniref:Embryo defective 1273 n=1 Tax=Rhizophora mucronata TaxID=61149 RepID=A0A2P2IPN5_RHIMU
MATPYPLQLSSASCHFRTSAKTALGVHSRFVRKVKGPAQDSKVHNCNVRVKPNGISQNARMSVCCGVNMAAGQSGDPEKINLEYLLDKARNLWDSSPQPVKSFPWNRALENFIQLILDLMVTVVKYLSVPLLLISSLSEMSYCAHQKKLFLVPFSLLLGIAVAGILRETAVEISPFLKDAEVPWHLIAIAIFFTLIKLPGPYYPYWGRIFIPHLANGVLWRTVWSLVFWHRRPKKASGAMLSNNSADGSHSEINNL